VTTQILGARSVWSIDSYAHYSLDKKAAPKDGLLVPFPYYLLNGQTEMNQFLTREGITASVRAS